MPGDLFIRLPSEQTAKEFFEKFPVDMEESSRKKLEELKKVQLIKGSQKTTEELKELLKKAIEELNGRSPASNQ